MLVYEPGQFFSAHQDSEKDDRMVGSLVVLLPSRSTGGDLVVSHRGQTETYRGSATALTFIAFYSDTRHEVLPVETGYRVALTYNLRVAGDATATRAAVLRDAADEAGCEATLALAEIRETWDVKYVEYRRGRRGWSSWDDDGPDPDDVDSLGSLLDSDVEIRPAEGRAVGARRVGDDELATATPSVELEPCDTEYTGNMGNYGNTMDRWYRRAAVVIWPRSRLRTEGER